MQPSMQRARKTKSYRDAESRFDFVAVYVIGGNSGPLRIAVSNDPHERLRVTLRNCAFAKHSGTRLLFHRWMAGEENGAKLQSLIHKAALALGLHSHDDFYAVSLPVAEALVAEVASKLGLTLIDDETKEAVVNRSLSRRMNSI